MQHTDTLNRIHELFEKKKENILSVFYTAGYPKLNDTILIAQLLEKAGVDMIEIGIPFSDPIADGPVIQASSKAAIDNGMTVKLLLEQVTQIRKSVNIPIILMGYLNPALQYGMDNFFIDAVAAGVDGLILPDLPFEEYKSLYKEKMESVNLCNTFLISPTTSEDRIHKIDRATNGFIYAVSSSSTTGAKVGFQQEQVDYFQRLASLKLKNPFLIGFGISDSGTFSTACKFSAGAIVGSAFIKSLQSSKDVSGTIQAFIGQIKQA